jgi:hypothetical protein
MAQALGVALPKRRSITCGASAAAAEVNVQKEQYTDDGTCWLLFQSTALLSMSLLFLGGCKRSASLVRLSVQCYNGFVGSAYHVECGCLFLFTTFPAIAP